MSFHDRELKEVYGFLKCSDEGLSGGEAARRLGHYGSNELKQDHRISRFGIFIEQFKSIIVFILIIATLISAFLGEWLDAIAILIILILNAVMGYIQEYRAEKAIEALKSMAAPKAKVIRDGKLQEIDSSSVVPGDIIVLEAGDKVPADARVIHSDALEAQEAVLTGESLPVKKRTGVIEGEVPLGDRKNMVFSGTIITKGKAKAVVVSTAMYTEVGKIAGMIQTAEDQETPLQKKLDVLGRRLGYLTIIVCAIVFGVGVLRGEEMLTMFLASVSLAVAAIPEGLPAVITISLAFGVQRMLRKNALVRKLPSVETLGSTTVICTDKTGTLTHNEMTVTKIYCNDSVMEVTGRGYKPDGEVRGRFEPLLFRIGILCNDADLIEDTWTVVGDPTEGCLLTSARKAGLPEKEIEKRYPRLGEVPFDSTRKRMTTVHSVDGKLVVYAKGAPDILLELCTQKLVNGKETPLTQEDWDRILTATTDFSKEALRVLAFAYKEVEHEEISEEDENNFVFVGLQAMIDPSREEVRDAIAKCRTAGIKVIMVTGDHKLTAQAIAKELGIEGEAVEGKDLEYINLDEKVEEIGIYARVSPEHKLKIVNALEKKGHIVAMTGDGVNDAPALKKADIGIAMGITGTDVAKEASEMVLTDDNFASIVNAVEEGRGIFDNIKKFVNYLLSSNFGEILVLFVAMLIGFRDPSGGIILPLVAIQILWMNLVTDGLPALALGVDPAEEGIMQRHPRNPKSGIITLNMGLNILVIGVLMCVATLFMFNMGLPDVERARTLALTTLVIMEIVRLQMIRQAYHNHLADNKYLVLSIIGVLALQAAAIYTPLNSILELVPIGLVDWLYIAVICAGMLALGIVASHFIKEWTHERD